MIEIETGSREVICKIEDRVALVTLNNPRKKNALGDELTPALRQIILDMGSRDDVGCVMIMGTGDAFCSGGDVSGMGGSKSRPVSEEERIDDLTRRQETLTGRIYHLSKPTVAALPGVAAGAGLSIALACDLRIASENAFITTAFKNIGLSGDYGASWFLPRLIGLARAKSLFYRADRIPSAEALQMGLFDAVFPQTSFREDAMAYAREIAQGPAQALQMMKVNLQKGLEQDLDASFRLEAKHMVKAGQGPEAREAISAFLEKRPPQFYSEN